MKPVNEITADIIDAAIQIHRKFGPGMYEKAYELLMQLELCARGHVVVRERMVDIVYRNVTVRGAFAIDLLVDDQVVVELKSCEKNLPVFAKQLKTYLVLFDRPVGLLINFGMQALKDGLERVVNRFEDSKAMLRTSLPPQGSAPSAFSACPPPPPPRPPQGSAPSAFSACPPPPPPRPPQGSAPSAISA